MWKACGRSGLTCLNLGCRLARGSDFIIVGHPEFQMGKVQAADAGRLWDLVQLMNHLDGEVSVFSYFMFSFCWHSDIVDVEAKMYLPTPYQSWAVNGTGTLQGAQQHEAIPCMGHEAGPAPCSTGLFDKSQVMDSDGCDGNFPPEKKTVNLEWPIEMPWPSWNIMDHHGTWCWTDRWEACAQQTGQEHGEESVIWQPHFEKNPRAHPIFQASSASSNLS